MTEVYAEAGIGNGTFFSTEYEEGEKEWRVPRFEKPKKVYGYYIRIWVFKHMFAFTTYEGMNRITSYNVCYTKLLRKQMRGKYVSLFPAISAPQISLYRKIV